MTAAYSSYTPADHTSLKAASPTSGAPLSFADWMSSAPAEGPWMGNYPPFVRSQPTEQTKPAKREKTLRPREYKSAEETVQSLSGGREDLLPRLVHYGGQLRIMPPSPEPHKIKDLPTVQLLQPTTFDTSGQTAPPGRKPHATAIFWEYEGTRCFQVEAEGVCVSRREDNHMINGSELLNIVGMSQGYRESLLKAEKTRNIVEYGPVHLTGIW
jgi:hypothetical protein